MEESTIFYLPDFVCPDSIRLFVLEANITINKPISN